MARLPRPSIPDSVKVAVALRQLRLLDAPAVTLERTEKRIGPYLERLLFALQVFIKTTKKLELHHRPALTNRPKIRHGGTIVGYVPAANDPDFLFWLPEDAHDVETRVRGLRGAHSDLGLARKLKKIAENREKRPPTGVAGKPKARHGRPRTSDSRPQVRPAKRKWPSRPFAKGRKFNSRKAP